MGVYVTLASLCRIPLLLGIGDFDNIGIITYPVRQPMEFRQQRASSSEDDMMEGCDVCSMAAAA